MNKIIPFNKEIKFDDNIGEITSIVLDDTLKFIDPYTIGGDLVVRGCHKYGDIEEDFSFPLATGITVDEKYDTSKATIKVDDFYYEIINEDTLKVKIDLILDDLFYKEQKIEPIIDENRVEIEEDENEKEDITNLITETPIEKDYSIYRVYIITNDDTLEKVLDKYHITKEELSIYNDLDNFKPGLKLIIPSTNE